MQPYLVIALASLALTGCNPTTDRNSPVKTSPTTPGAAASRQAPPPAATSQTPAGAAAPVASGVPQGWVGTWNSGCGLNPDSSNYETDQLTIAANGNTNQLNTAFADAGCTQQLHLVTVTTNLVAGAANSLVPGATESTATVVSASYLASTQNDVTSFNRSLATMAQQYPACAGMTVSNGLSTNISACMKSVNPVSYSLVAIRGVSLLTGYCSGKGACQTPAARATSLDTSKPYTQQK